MVKKQSNIYIPKWLHEQLKKYFQENREALVKEGIKSVNGLATAWIQLCWEIKSGRHEILRSALLSSSPSERVVTEPSRTS